MNVSIPRWTQRCSAALTTVALVFASVALASSAVADTAPAVGTPGTVSADALPTVQIDGVVWQQAIAGTTVYAGGEFSTARPAGAAAGTSTVVRDNLLAYDLTTGVLIDSWAPDANATVRAVAASPDGSRVYVGGNFTTIAGQARYRIAAFDTATGRLVAQFNPGVNAQVRAIVATDTTVYVAGIFTQANNQPRARLAAFNAADGALLPWNPRADDGTVSALALSPDGSIVVAGGSFTVFNGSDDPGYGLARIDSATGASLPFPANSLIRDAGTQSSILSLSGDESGVYGTGYVFGAGGNFEGTFRASWETGGIVWMEDCHGDTYSSWPAKDVVYIAGHAHYCGNVGGFPQTEPWSFHRALAFTKARTGTITADPHGYTSFAGNPSPTLLNWYPELEPGSFTGQGQGPWTVTGNDDYVLYGGEFTHVNNVRQQGLVRFTATTRAPNRQGPRVAAADFTPTVASFAAGTARVSWQANYDRDNEVLTYQVTRDGTVVYRVTASSVIWNRPMMGFLDEGLTPGVSYTYKVRATDPFGNTALSDAAPVTVVGTSTVGAYARRVLDDGASSYWRLGEGSGSTAYTWAGWADATTGTGVTRGVPGAVFGDPDTAAGFDGTSGGSAATRAAEEAPDTFTLESWVRTTSTRGGKIIGFGGAATGVSTVYDRHVYLDDSGRVWFGVYPGAVRTVNSSQSYNDGAWHHVVASVGPGGMRLWVDGKIVGQRADTTAGQDSNGYWRLGGDNLDGWPSQPTDGFLAGALDEVAVYPTVLSPATVGAHEMLGRTGEEGNLTPASAFTVAVSGLAVTVDGSESADPDGTIASFAWSFGDGAAASEPTAAHTYAAAGSYQVTLTVTDDAGGTGAATRQVAVEAPVIVLPKIERYVTRVYDDLFGRAPDPQGLATWTTALRAGTPRAAVANSITYSTEYRSGLIRGSYDSFLDREPDPGGLEYWLGQMGRGMTIQQMEGGFLASQEYYNQSGGNDGEWVRRLYGHVLGRDAAPAEVEYWVSRVATSGRYGVAMGFLLSTEHLAAVLDGYYHDLLGRSLDPSGRRTWVAQIQGGVRVEAVIGGIISSEEYFASC